MSWSTTLAVRFVVRDEENEPADELVLRARDGDRQALVTIYCAHFAEVRALATRLLGCRMTAEDVIHEVFEALPRALKRFRGEGTLRSYLLSMTVRTSRTYQRAARRRRAAEAKAAEVRDLTQLNPQGETPSAISERRELARLLANALDELPEAQRVAFVLCELEERSSQEAAAILGDKPGTVRARVFKAKRCLRQWLSQRAPNVTVIDGGFERA